MATLGLHMHFHTIHTSTHAKLHEYLYTHTHGYTPHTYKKRKYALIKNYSNYLKT